MKIKFNIIFIAFVVITSFGFRGCQTLFYFFNAIIYYQSGDYYFFSGSQPNEQFHKIAVGQDGVIYTSIGRESQLWQESQSGTTNNLYFVKMFNDYGFINSAAVGDSGTILVSSDNGITWTNKSIPNLNKNLYAFDFLYTQDPELNYVVCGDSGIIYKSSNSGGVFTWQQINPNRNKRLNTIADVYYDNIIAAGENGTILKTIDGGANWIDLSVSDTTINFNRILLGLTVKSWNYVWLVGDNGKIFVSTDYGYEWSEKISGTTEDLYDIVFKNPNDGVVAGANGVVKYTSDGGMTWHEDTYLSSLTDKDIISLTLVDSNTVSSLTVNNYNKYSKNSNIAGGDTTYFLTVSSEPLVSVDDEKSAALTQYKLHQNYPNPFNPTTKISWQSPVSSHQSLKVYDVLGNEIATLVDEYKPAGNYEVDFNQMNISSGIYFYKLSAGSFSETKKMILMK
jgi:photosystem II stability/assembly factor-like uncharacterized protein